MHPVDVATNLLEAFNAPAAIDGRRLQNAKPAKVIGSGLDEVRSSA
jgi:hypothetical protein